MIASGVLVLQSVYVCVEYKRVSFDSEVVCLIQRLCGDSRWCDSISDSVCVGYRGSVLPHITVPLGRVMLSTSSKILTNKPRPSATYNNVVVITDKRERIRRRKGKWNGKGTVIEQGIATLTKDGPTHTNNPNSSIATPVSMFSKELSNPPYSMRVSALSS